MIASHGFTAPVKEAYLIHGVSVNEGRKGNNIVFSNHLDFLGI